jgi:hypothetical protein
MSTTEPTIDPMATDPERWGHSLGNLMELLLPCLDAAAPESIVEVGAYAGDVTRLLLRWAAGRGARVWSVDPDPQEALVALAAEHPELELVRETSHAALAALPSADAVIIDGDHNYYTVSEELRLIAEGAARDGVGLPLLLCHDVCWPHGRRDAYYAPDQIPPEHRQPMSGGFVFPGDEGLHNGGLPYPHQAKREGGERNGVLTAIEDFVAERDDVELAIVPAFFGFGVVWRRDAPYAESLVELLAPFDRHPMLERLEGNRVLHLATWQQQRVDNNWLAERNARKDALLRKLLESRTFAIAVALSRLRQGGTPAFSKEEIRRVLED